MDDKCKCKFCTTYDKYKWAVIMECGCNCHDSKDIDGHDGLCCEFPNGKRANNPYSDLLPAAEYKKVMDEILREFNGIKIDGKS